jgi:hypothetical protein
MRALAARKLTALGYSVGQKVKIRGVDATCLSNQTGDPLLLVSNSWFGPSWAQVHKALEHLDPKPILITAGNTPVVVIADSEEGRTSLGGLFDAAIASRGKQVHLEGVGFVELETKAKLDLRLFVLPLFSIVAVVALGMFWLSSQQPSQNLEPDPVAIGCVVDSDRSEFERWLIESLGSESELGLGQEIQVSTATGKLNVVVESKIGSAAKITGTASCKDGRERAINHRVDTSGSGAVLELGQ